ncbi:MAG: hypothetical protein FRX49_04908 [Trebouxia sp. A1-2]|nr:MAG: hypothetical protein FRX49_04908 [Trebouxia sp. A1-2]
MHNVFQEHYHRDPQHRFPHIPSIPVRVPVAMSTQMSLCYSSRYLQQQLVITNEDLRATAAALLDAVRQLEFDSDAQIIQQTNQEDGRKPMRKFFIKRNYSDAAQDMDDALHDAQQLFKAAERIVKESCGEKWLLQPFIPDMERNEYRVYMVGGAEATGAPNDTAVVYTPAFHAYDDKGQQQVYVWNMTLPQHFFSRAPVDPDQQQSRADYNSSQVDQYYVSYFPFPIWRDESMHELIVNVAKCAADAVAHSGRSIRMGQHVMIRVDIALTHQGSLAKPFISEAHVFNDAGLSFDVWAPETGLASAQPSTRETGVADSSHNLSYGDGMHKITANQQPLVGDSCSADIAIAVGTCPAGSHNESVGGQGGNEWTNTSPGYLLAVKLWQEAIATDAAASRNAEDIHSFIH